MVIGLALAGCGGSSDNGQNPPAGDGNNYDCADGTKTKDAAACLKQIQDAQDEKAEMEEAAKALTANAKTLHGLLSNTTSFIVDNDEDNEPNQLTAPAGSDIVKAFNKAKEASDGLGSEEKAQVFVSIEKMTGQTSPTPTLAFDANAANAKYIAGSGFATGQSTKTHKNNDVVRGTYEGATGGYVCGGDDCTSQRTSDGVLLGGSNWTWDLDSGQEYKKEDLKVAEYGWWIDEGLPTSTNPKVGVWYDIPNPFNPNDTNGDDTGTPVSTGKATYNGDAGGQVALYNARTPSSNVGGAFTADAKLEADFDKDEISGSITEFYVGGVKQEGWSVALNKTANVSNYVADGFGRDGQTATTGVNATQWTIGQEKATASGSWNARFYGTVKNEHQPKGIAGNFHSAFGLDGHMIGGFSAER